MATATTQQLPEDYGTALDRYPDDPQQNSTLQAAAMSMVVALLCLNLGLVNVARTFGNGIAVEEAAAHEQGMNRRIKNAEYLGTLLG